MIRNAYIAASGEEIVALGPESELAHISFDGRQTEIDARGAAVIPGYVDAHSHLIWLGERSDEYALRAAGTTYAEIAAAGGGIRSTVQATAAGSVEELVEAAKPRARRMLQGGTTTVEIKLTG